MNILASGNYYACEEKPKTKKAKTPMLPTEIYSQFKFEKIRTEATIKGQSEFPVNLLEFVNITTH
jgi:hypothetical protein